MDLDNPYTPSRVTQPQSAAQVFAGSKQKELEVGSMALMAGYTPIASAMLGLLVPIFEPLGLKDAGPDTLLGFAYTPQVCTPSSRVCFHHTPPPHYHPLSPFDGYLLAPQFTLLNFAYTPIHPWVYAPL